MVENVEWRGLIDGQVMFGISGPPEFARREAYRYAYQYLEEGDVMLQARDYGKGKWQRVTCLKVMS